MNKDIPSNCENPAELLKTRQAYSLSAKIYLSTQRIKEWYEYWNGQVYVSFSGGKDSTVLLHLVRSVYPEVPAVFSDTGLEYPEIKEFVKSIDNVTWLKPKLTYKQVIEKYGYPIISKEQSKFLYEYRTSKSEKLKSIRINGNKWNLGKISKKWKFLIDAPFGISDKCCYVMKKSPFKSYETRTKRKPYLGIMADESSMRIQSYVRYGCNAFDLNRPTSNPLMFWIEKDVWQYIREKNLPYSKIYDMGADRTGCMWCMFGVHLEEEPNRFQRMKKTHPKIYKYCIETLGLGNVLDYIDVSYL